MKLLVIEMLSYNYLSKIFEIYSHFQLSVVLLNVNSQTGLMLLTKFKLPESAYDIRPLCSCSNMTPGT